METIPEETDDRYTKHYHGETGREYWYHELSGESRWVDEVRFVRDVGSVNTRVILNVMEGLILLKLNSNVCTVRARSSLSPFVKDPGGTGAEQRALAGAHAADDRVIEL